MGAPPLPPLPPQSPDGNAPPPATNRLAIISLVLGAIGLIVTPLSAVVFLKVIIPWLDGEEALGLLIVLEAGRVLASLAAIICGHVARRQIRKADGREEGKGIALAGLICGYLWVLAPLALALFILLVLIWMGQMSVG